MERDKELSIDSAGSPPGRVPSASVLARAPGNSHGTRGRACTCVLHGPSDCAPSVLEVKVGSRTWAGRFQQTACRPQGRSVPALTDFVMVASAVPSTVSLSLPPSPPGPVRPRHTSSEWQWRPAAGSEGGV